MGLDNDKCAARDMCDLVTLVDVFDCNDGDCIDGDSAGDESVTSGVGGWLGLGDGSARGRLDGVEGTDEASSGNSGRLEGEATVARRRSFAEGLEGDLDGDLDGDFIGDDERGSDEDCPVFL